MSFLSAAPMADPKPAPRPYHNYSSGRIADELGALRAHLKQLEEKEKLLKQELVHRGLGTHYGTHFQATVSRPTRETLDTKALKEEYPQIAAMFLHEIHYDLVRTTANSTLISKGVESE